MNLSLQYDIGQASDHKLKMRHLWTFYIFHVSQRNVLDEANFHFGLRVAFFIDSWM